MKIRLVMYRDAEIPDDKLAEYYGEDLEKMLREKHSGADIIGHIRKVEGENIVDTLLMGDNKIAIQINNEITEIPQTVED